MREGNVCKVPAVQHEKRASETFGREPASPTEGLDSGTVGAGLLKERQPRVRILCHEADLVRAGLVVHRHEPATARDEVVDDVGQDARNQGDNLGRLLRARIRVSLRNLHGHEQ